MLRALFEWLDAHPQAYWLSLTAPTLALFGWVAAALRATEETAPPRRADWLFALLLLAFLLAWRWPFLLAAHEYNLDESSLIAGAITLAHDPVFWRSLDGATSGPLNYYALLPLHLIGLPLDYFTARLTGLLLIWGALLACYRLFRSMAPAGAARLAVLPAAVFFAAATDWDLVHYSSEHVSLFLTALAACCLFSGAGIPSAGTRLLLGGWAAGLLPWAKLQAAPLMAAFIGIKLWHILWARNSAQPERREWTRRLLTAAGAPSVVAIIAIAVSGQLENFFRGYLLQNIHYVGEPSASGHFLLSLFGLSRELGHIPLYFAGAALSLLLCGSLYWHYRQRPGRMFVASAICFCASLFCVLAPRRAFLHYLLLAVVPLTWWTGAAVAELWPRLSVHRARRGFVLSLLAVGGLLPLAWRWSQDDPDPLGRLAEDWRHPRSVIGNLVRANSRPGDHLGIWGWSSAFYVESSLPQATRDAQTIGLMSPSFQQDYYRARYLADLKSSEPPFFIDAVGPALFFSDRSISGHETFPALAEYIRADYRLLFDSGSARLFVRRDAPAPKDLSAAEIERLEADARRAPGLDASRPLSISPADAPQWTVRGFPMQMMLPPTMIAWHLDGTEREVWFDYGFHSRAYTEGRTNGAGFTVELQTLGHAPQLLFHRLIDPQRRAADRRPLSTRVILPPIRPGAKLLVRTDPGESGDSAWDWVYLKRARYFRSPGYVRSQFKGFNRVPDSVDAEQTSLIDGEEGPYLSVHTPAFLSFALGGTEQLLQFDYGLEDGAYTKGGQTDGAVFTVELRRRTGKAQIIFERYLQPAAIPDDRGRQHASLSLANIGPGDRLLLRIGPGNSNSWDWTYVANLSLK